MSSASERPPRRAPWILGFSTLATYVYFFQGLGWNQNSHYATIRALVDRGTAEISAYAGNTGDVSRAGGQTFSNKPPGLALMGALVYWPLYRIERARGLDLDSIPVLAHTQHVLAIFLSAVPGTILVVLVYHALVRDGVGHARAIALAGAFAFGTLIWPYSGIMMSHVMTAMLLFAAWYALTGDVVTTARATLAGLLLAAALLCDLLVAPAIVILLAYAAWRRGWRSFAALACCALLGVIALAAYNHWAYGRVATAVSLHSNQQFRQPDLFLGMFGWPQWRRLYWITLHPMRGMLSTCPVLLVPIFGWGRISAGNITALLIIAYYVLFELCFFGWTGGYGTGIRYFVPTLAFAWLFAPAGFARMPRIAPPLAAASIVMMALVTTVRVQVPANDAGQPEGQSPVWRAWYDLRTFGTVAESRGAYNLGMLAGLRGWPSALPAICVLGGFWIYVARINFSKRVKP